MIDINLTDVASETDLNNHVLDTANPHDVTKTQVGLGNVDNTSDVDKPISSATQTALNAKENNLPSIVGNSLKVLRVNAGETGKEWATISSGLTIGTTPITSGTIGRILFEGAGNVVQEDSAFFWDNTNKRLGIGATPNTSTRLDVRAQGALSTDIAFRVRNSADTTNLFIVSGNGVLTGVLPTIFQNVDGSSDVSYRARASLSYFEIIQTAYNNASENLKAATTLGKIAFTGASSQNKLNFVNSATYWGTGGIYSGGFHWYKSEVSGDPTVTRISSSCTNANRQMWLTPENSLILSNTSGITYTTNTDSFQQYSADITAGNAAPHFRTENGSVIKLYKQNLATNPTNAEIATFLSNLGLANLI